MPATILHYGIDEITYRAAINLLVESRLRKSQCPLAARKACAKGRRRRCHTCWSG